MSELLLVNPRRRKRRSGKRKMTAKQAKYFGGGRKKSRRRSRTSALSRSPSKIRAPAKRRRRRSGRVRRAVSSGRRMLGGLIPGNFIKGTLVPAAIGGAGALAVDIAWGFAPIPAGIKTGPFAPVAKVAGALVVGMIAGKVAGRAMGEKVTAGYLTVLAYNLIKGAVSKALPQLPMGDYDMGWVQAGPFVPDASMGVYLAPPAPVGDSMPEGMSAYLNGWGDEVS